MPASDYTSLYEFERLLSATIEALFNSKEMKSIGVSEASDDLQKDRPRVEVFVSMGGRFGEHFVVTADGIRRENGWTASLHLTCVTGSDYKIHSAYIAAVRELASRLDRLDLSNAQIVNPVLQYHEITRISTAGTNSQIKPQEGAYQSMLSYEMIFAIRADAWPGGISPTTQVT
jgi:hypothetical protein